MAHRLEGVGEEVVDGRGDDGVEALDAAAGVAGGDEDVFAIRGDFQDAAGFYERRSVREPRW